MSPEALDNPVWAAPAGPHRSFAEYGPAGPAVRYRADATPFAALADPEDPRAWADLAALAGPGEGVWLTGLVTPPAGWHTAVSVPGVQLDGRAVRAEPAPEAVPLGLADVPEMLVRERGDSPFLHVARENAGALRLYGSMGFAPRRRPLFLGLRTPPGAA
ncbi:hypothetical protein ACFWSF_19505 [Streptomyces sp. NPDC058611]|uniref:hypothetical protein n=1 Tax=unclassified Streptomyces TaxID=2593676 RepID=UPI0036468A58